MDQRKQEHDRAKALITYTRRISTMIDLGVNLASCNGVIQQDGPAPYDVFCRDLQDRWERGDWVTLAAAMEERPDLFTSFYASMIKWGEIGGVLQDSFAQMAELLEETYGLWAAGGKQGKWTWLLHVPGTPVPEDWTTLDRQTRLLVLTLFLRSLGSMLSAGVGFLTATHTAAEFLPTRQKAEFCRNLEGYTREHGTFAGYLSTLGIFPAMLIKLAEIGEQNATLDPLLEKAGMAYQKELECELG